MSFSRTVRLAVLLVVCGAAGWGAIASSSSAQAGPVDASPLEFRADEQVVVVLKDGTELPGALVRETDTEIAIRSAFGVTTIDRSRVKEIRRGENPWRKEFQTRFDRARRLKKARSYSRLGEWAELKGLSAESERAHRAAIDLESDHEPSRLALGHARHEGRWIEAERVAELEDSGYERVGLDLVKRSGAAPAKEKVTEKPEARKLTPEEEKERAKAEERRAKLLEKRRKQREKFEEQRRAEFKGVPWGSAHKIRTKNYEIVCNSTREVAKTYSTIMEALYGSLSKRFKQRHVRSGRMTVFVYKTQQEFMNRTGMGPNTGGFYRPDNEQVHAYHGTFGNTGTTYSVLAHEGTHQFQGRVLPNMGNMNQWIIEGFAVYFGDGSRIDYKKKKIVTGIIPRDRLLHIQDKMREGTHRRLSQLAGLQRNRFGGSEYADSWAILYFLLNGPEKEKGQKFIQQYWLMGTDHRIGQSEFDELADHYFGGVRELEKMYVDFILGLEPEAAGEVDDDGGFTSYDFMFEILQPDPTWEYHLEGLKRNELVALVPENTVPKDSKDHRIAVRLLPKSDERQRAADYLEEVVLPGLEKKYSNVTHEAVSLNEYSAYALEWVDPEPKKEEDKKEGDEKEGEEAEKGGPAGGDGDKKDEPEVVPLVRKQYRAYLIVGVTNAYMIQGEFPIDQFSRYVDSLEQVALSFSRIFKNRW